MRTTLTLDPDVAREVERLRRESGRSLKDIVNSLMRAGIGQLEGSARGQRRAWTTPSHGGRLLVSPIELASTGTMLARLDEEDGRG